MLRAVGVGSSAVPATAVAASIKWITKDGVGALGRLFVGGRLGLYIDQHPREWRMAADVIVTVGLSLEIATVFFPSQFLLLAGTGNFARALATGMAKPSLRVIQQHFARNNNIGEVSAKEESWEVAGQFTGLLTSVVILSSLQDATGWEPVLVTWAIFHSIHVVCRFIALRCLQFDSLSLVRSSMLIQLHLAGQPLTDPATMAQKQQILTDWLLATPSIEFGSSLKYVSERLVHNARFSSWIDVYREEQYLLFVEEGHGFVVLKQGGGAKHCLKALWQFLWLQQQSQHHWTPGIDAFHQSLRETNMRFGDFLTQLEEAGWKPQILLYRLKSTRVSQIGTTSLE